MKVLLILSLVALALAQDPSVEEVPNDAPVVVNPTTSPPVTEAQTDAVTEGNEEEGTTNEPSTTEGNDEEETTTEVAEEDEEEGTIEAEDTTEVAAETTTSVVTEKPCPQCPSAGPNWKEFLPPWLRTKHTTLKRSPLMVMNHM